MVWKELTLAGIIALTPSSGYLRADDTTIASNSGISDKLQAQVTRLADLGTTLAYRGKFQESLEAYQRADKIKPNCDDIIAGMATAYSKMDEPEKADALFRRSLKLDPDDFETNINYAGHLCRERKFSEAIPFIKTALETSPKNKVALGWLKYAKTYSMKQ